MDLIHPSIIIYLSSYLNNHDFYSFIQTNKRISRLLGSEISWKNRLGQHYSIYNNLTSGTWNQLYKKLYSGLSIEIDWMLILTYNYSNSESYTPLCHITKSIKPQVKLVPEVKYCYQQSKAFKIINEIGTMKFIRDLRGEQLERDKILSSISKIDLDRDLDPYRKIKWISRDINKNRVTLNMGSKYDAMDIKIMCRVFRWINEKYIITGLNLILEEIPSTILMIQSLDNDYTIMMGFWFNDDIIDKFIYCHEFEVSEPIENSLRGPSEVDDILENFGEVVPIDQIIPYMFNWILD